MHIALLNWAGGENDPFTAINHELRRSLQAFGCEVTIVATDGELAQRLFVLNLSHRIDGVITHQGICSNLRIRSNDRLIWDELGLHLLCLHSDHPALNPINHQADSAYVTHTYCVPHHVEFANASIPRSIPARFLAVPSFYLKREVVAGRKGDYFVFPKNVDTIRTMTDEWTSRFSGKLLSLLMEAANDQVSNYLAGEPVDHHTILDQRLTERLIGECMASLNLDDPAKLRHWIHGWFDKVRRNIASEMVLRELAEIPLHIIGRGWDEYRQAPSRFHKFSSLDVVSNGDFQFYSRFGIIDIVPNKMSLHDRTLRAIAHHGGFLCDSKLPFDALGGGPYSDLFFTGSSGDLKSKAMAVIENPERHLERCRQFGNEMLKTVPFEHFCKYLQDLFGA